MQVNFLLNQRPTTVDVEPGMPLLWLLRDVLQLTGTKYGCGMALCGACTVHLDGVAVRACMTPAAELEGRAVTTIEGLAPEPGSKESTGALHPLQQAWVDENVPQCGYCQPGQIMSAAALLAATPQPSREDIRRCLSGNLCRCGMYQRIERAVARAAGLPIVDDDATATPPATKQETP